MSEPPYAPYPPNPPYQPDRPFPQYPAQQPYPQQQRQQGPPQPRPVQRRPDPETASHVRAAYAARSELGPEYEDAIAAGLAERVEELVAYRTADLRHADKQTKEERADARSRENHRFVLGIISLGSGIPITAIAANSVDPGLIGVMAVWGGIVGVNAIFAKGSRRKSRD